MVKTKKNQNANNTQPTSLAAGRTGGGRRVLARSEREDAGPRGGDVDVETAVSGAGGGQETALHQSLPVPVVQALVAPPGLGEDQLEVARGV